MSLWELWPAAVLMALPLPLGVALGFAADTWLKLRDLCAEMREERA